LFICSNLINNGLTFTIIRTETKVYSWIARHLHTHTHTTHAHVHICRDLSTFTSIAEADDREAEEREV